MRVELQYGMQGTLPHTFIGDDRRGIYLGIDEQGRYVILQRKVSGIVAHHAKGLIAKQWYTEDNIPYDDRAFILDEVKEVRELKGAEELFAQRILLQRLQP